MGYLKLYDVKNPFVDARGNVLKSGDYVLSVNNWMRPVIGTFKEDMIDVIGDSHIAYMVVSQWLRHEIAHSFSSPEPYDREYILKLDDNFKSNYIALISMLVNVGGYDVSTFQYNELEVIEKCCIEMYKRQTGKKNISGLPIMDYLGKDVRVGDLVLYFCHEKGPRKSRETLRYGIVMSKTQILTENLEKKPVHFVLKLENLVQYEVDLQDILLNKLNN